PGHPPVRRASPGPLGGQGHRPPPAAPDAAHERGGHRTELPVDRVGQLDLTVAREIPAVLETLADLEEHRHREERNRYDHQRGKQYDHDVPPLLSTKTPEGGVRETRGRGES